MQDNDNCGRIQYFAIYLFEIAESARKISMEETPLIFFFKPMASLSNLKFNFYVFNNTHIVKYMHINMYYKKRHQVDFSN